MELEIDILVIRTGVEDQDVTEAGIEVVGGPQVHTDVGDLDLGATHLGGKDINQDFLFQIQEFSLVSKLICF